MKKNSIVRVDPDEDRDNEGKVEDVKMKDADVKVARHPGGRPSKYKPEYAELAKNFYELGATDYEVARYLKVDPHTIYTWQTQHPEFLQSTRLGKEAADERVEKALLSRALGYEYRGEKIVSQKDGTIVRVETNEVVHPDVQAASLWLRNRQPHKWRDRQEVEHQGGVTLIVDEKVRKL